MTQCDFFYNRRQLHADLSSWIAGHDGGTRRKVEGELRDVDSFVTRTNKISASADFEAHIPLSALFSERTWQRALQAGTGSTGGYLVSAVLSGFEAILRNVLVLGRAGAQVLPNLGSNAVFPRQQAANTFSYLAEGATCSTSDQSFSQVGASPRRFSGTASFSRQLWRQAPEIQSEQLDSFGRDCLAASEKAAFQGTGGVQPLGIFSTQGVNQITFSGAATLATLELFEQDLAQSNVDLSRVCFIIDPLTLAKWRQITRSTNASTYLVNESSAYAGALSVLGYSAWVTQNLPGSSCIAADFSKLSLCYFGSGDDPPVRLTIDPYASKKQEQVEVTADLRQDVVVRRETAFAINSGSTTQ